MGKINKSLKKVKLNATNLLNNIQTLKTNRKNDPNKTADTVKNIGKSARIMKASIRSLSSLFANFIIGDIDSALQLVQTSAQNLEDAHKNMNIPAMEESLSAIENKSEILPTVIDNLQEFINAFQNFPQFKDSQDATTLDASKLRTPQKNEMLPEFEDKPSTSSSTATSYVNQSENDEKVNTDDDDDDDDNDSDEEEDALLSQLPEMPQ